MNQLKTTSDLQASNTTLYMFDCDGLLYRHTPACYEHMRDVGAKVIQAYTDLPFDQARDMGCQSWDEYGDGFFLLKKTFGEAAYHGAHRHFDMVSRLDVCGERDENLPQAIEELSAYADICFYSHTGTRSLKMIMTRLGYNPIMVDQYAHGIDAFACLGRARKDDGASGIYNHIASRHNTTPGQIVLIEDSKSNLKCAKESGVGRSVLVDWGQGCPQRPAYVDETFDSTIAFVEREIRHHQSRLMKRRVA